MNIVERVEELSRRRAEARLLAGVRLVAAMRRWQIRRQQGRLHRYAAVATHFRAAREKEYVAFGELTRCEYTEQDLVQQQFLYTSPRVSSALVFSWEACSRAAGSSSVTGMDQAGYVSMATKAYLVFKRQAQETIVDAALLAARLQRGWTHDFQDEAALSESAFCMCWFELAHEHCGPLGRFRVRGRRKKPKNISSGASPILFLRLQQHLHLNLLMYMPLHLLQLRLCSEPDTGHVWRISLQLHACSQAATQC